MPSLVRTLLVWLLVFAVPAQAAAAVTMAFCGPNHDGRGAAAHVQQPLAADHSHHGNVAHQHGQAATHPDEGASALSDASSPVKSSDASSHKCSACASCCSAAAIFDTVPAVPAPAVSPTVFPAFAQRVDPFAAAGPERPPRIVLA
jgi:hypothetical protein